MKSLLDLIKALYGPKAISSTIGTRTNVIRLPSGKLQKYLSKDLNIEAASDEAAVNAYKEMQELVPEIAKMNDGERLVFEGNLRRLKNKLEETGLIQKENVSSGITALESKVEQLRQKGKELEKVTGPSDDTQEQSSVQTSAPSASDGGGGITTINQFAPLSNPTTGDNTADAMRARLNALLVQRPTTYGIPAANQLSNYNLLDLVNLRR